MASRHITATEVAACSSWATTITVTELKKLWEPAAQGKVKTWSQVRAGWPDREIHLFGPDGDSGTFDYFNDVINGAAKSSRTDFTGHVDDNKIVAAVAADELALGYVGFTYFDTHKDTLTALAVDDLKDQAGPGPIELTVTNVHRGVYMPLSRPLFIYVRASSLDRPEVQQLVDYCVRFSPQIVEAADGIRLSPREQSCRSSG
jgi:phosphate transport system substrate-binding protein